MTGVVAGEGRQDAERRELEKLRKYARRASIVLMRFSGGGSEMFERIADEFYAEPELCERRFRHREEMLERLRHRQEPSA